MSKPEKQKQEHLIHKKYEHFNILEGQELAKNVFDPNFPTNYNDLNNYCTSNPKLAKYDLPEYTPETDVIKSHFYEFNQDFFQAHSIANLNRFEVKLQPYSSYPFIYSKLDISSDTKFLLEFTRKIPAGKNREIHVFCKLWPNYNKEVERNPASRQVGWHEPEGEFGSYARRYPESFIDALLDKKEFYSWRGFYVQIQISLVNLKRNKAIRKKIFPRQYCQYGSLEYLRNIYTYGFPVCLGEDYLVYQQTGIITFLDRRNFKKKWTFKDEYNSSYRKLFFLKPSGVFFSFRNNPCKIDILKLKNNGFFKKPSLEKRSVSIKDKHSISIKDKIDNHAFTVDQTGRYIFFVTTRSQLKIYDLKKEELLLKIPFNPRYRIIDLAYD
ncbi:MAG: hypothetical protein ACQES9_12940, partial [Myxococcota bacterium]